MLSIRDFTERRLSWREMPALCCRRTAAISCCTEVSRELLESVVITGNCVGMFGPTVATVGCFCDGKLAGLELRLELYGNRFLSPFRGEVRSNVSMWPHDVFLHWLSNWASTASCGPTECVCVIPSFLIMTAEVAVPAVCSLSLWFTSVAFITWYNLGIWMVSSFCLGFSSDSFAPAVYLNLLCSGMLLALKRLGSDE